MPEVSAEQVDAIIEAISSRPRIYDPVEDRFRPIMQAEVDKLRAAANAYAALKKHFDRTHVELTELVDAIEKAAIEAAEANTDA